jgi:hypothetical protein
MMQAMMQMTMLVQALMQVMMQAMDDGGVCNIYINYIFLILKIKNLDENLFKNVFFWIFFSNECTIIFYFKEKTTTISKRRRCYTWALHYFFNFLLFDNVS